MNELIRVAPRAIGTNDVQAVNARDLHAFLEVGKDFSNWIKNRIEQYGFERGRDFETLAQTGERENQGLNGRIDYFVTLDMAKELSMVERNEKGKQARQYFLECERRAREAPVLNPANLSRLQLIELAMKAEQERLEAEEARALLENRVVELEPKAAALDRISAGGEAVTFTQAAKVLGVKRNYLTTFMHANGWVYRQNGSWVAYDQQIRSGRLVYKEATYTDDETGQERCKPYCHITPKGLTRLAEMLGTGAIPHL